MRCPWVKYPLGLRYVHSVLRLHIYHCHTVIIAMCFNDVGSRWPLIIPLECAMHSISSRFLGSALGGKFWMSTGGNSRCWKTQNSANGRQRYWTWRWLITAREGGYAYSLTSLGGLEWLTPTTVDERIVAVEVYRMNAGYTELLCQPEEMKNRWSSARRCGCAAAEESEDELSLRNPLDASSHRMETCLVGSDYTRSAMLPRWFPRSWRAVGRCS